MISKEICWNIVNSLLAGAISFGSAVIATGEVNTAVILVSSITAGLVALIRFAEYWKSEENEYSDNHKNKIFAFL
jgi:hypothetical protein